MQKFYIVLSIIVSGFFIQCQMSEPMRPESKDQQEQVDGTIPALSKKTVDTGGMEEAVPSPLLLSVNRVLQSAGKNYCVALAEVYTGGANAPAGRTLYFKDVGNKQWGYHWVTGDPRRGGRTHLTWTIDTELTSHVSGAECVAAIDRAMQTWNSVTCATIPLEKVGPYGQDLGVMQYLTGLGGLNGYGADITQAGWLPRQFFDMIYPPNGGSFVLGVTYTFIFLSNGNPTDINNDGKIDVAFRETYYNEAFPWGIDQTLFDIESVVLHENGHSMSISHFGTAFRTDANGMLHFSPRAVMNSTYSGIQQKIYGPDLAAFCSIWGSWPNK